VNPFAYLADLVAAGLDRLEAEGALPQGLDRTRISVEPPRDPAHGEAASNAALILAKPARMRPLDLAERLTHVLAEEPEVARATAAPPGFVNLAMKPRFWQRHLAVILQAGHDYGASAVGAGKRVNVEYCSANPTGPLHVGHGRGTVFGDALASLLAFAGYAVTREYYVNDGGAQVETLARSIHHRYREVLGVEAGPLPDGHYPGAYLLPVAGLLLARTATGGSAPRRGLGWTASPAPAWRRC
jgi:arginyl-tRNA synthetase